jgi:Tfp pilus assembly protein PilX
MTRFGCQDGAVLIMSLLMLQVITLLTVSSINSSVVDLRIVDNMRAQQEAETQTQQAIEQVLSSADNFDADAVAQTITIHGVAVKTAKPRCIRAMPAAGYSAVWQLAPEDTVWVLEGSLEDASTGARTTLHQGAQIRLVAGSCP